MIGFMVDETEQLEPECGGHLEEQCMYVCMYVYIYVHEMYVCMYIYIYIYSM